MESQFQRVVQTLSTGSVTNMVMGGVGTLLINTLTSFPVWLKTLLFWLGGLSVALILGYTIHKKLYAKKVNLVYVGAGVALGVFAMIVFSHLAYVIFPNARPATLEAVPGMADDSLQLLILSAGMGITALSGLLIAYMVKKK